MKRKTVVSLGIAGLCLLVMALAWNGIKSYEPSKDGIDEAEIALKDLRNYCAMDKTDCSQLSVERRLAPVSSPLCRETEGKSICDEGKGYWSFVVRIGNGQRYLIAVLPFGDKFSPVGPMSEITPLPSQHGS
jgi:hypothetical protein